MAKECGWDYTGEDLGSVYAEAQQAIGSSSLTEVLRKHYRDCKPASWHFEVAKLHWRRIYTTNIDDVVENSYSTKSAQKLDKIVVPEDFLEMDEFYERVQCVHLHGAILDPGKGFTFTIEEMAEITARANPWYQALLEDMARFSVLFVGTELNESPFHHYMALRSEKRQRPEQRARAFLISPKIPQIRGKQLKRQNIHAVRATGEEFFAGLVQLMRPRVKSSIDIVARRAPHVVKAIRESQTSDEIRLLRDFEPITPGDFEESFRQSNERSQFYLGAEPTWSDIIEGVDAKRRFLDEIVEKLSDMKDGVKSLLIEGVAGSGKSTLLMRIAYDLALAGETVFFAKPSSRIDFKNLESVTRQDTLYNRPFFFIDDADGHVAALDRALLAFSHEVNATFVLAASPHRINSRLAELRQIRPSIERIPDLDENDSHRILDKLDELGLLGVLKGKSRRNQLKEFVRRSGKQLLVALREATRGRGFDAILTGEFSELASQNAKLAYTIACLCYCHGAPIRRRHLLACLDGDDLEKMTVLNQELDGVLLDWGNNEEFFRPRHRIIARTVVTGIAPYTYRIDALTRFLSKISGDVTPRNIKLRSPEYVAYRGMANFEFLRAIFGDDHQTITEFYRYLQAYYGEDFLFWLQFGISELHFDQFQTAENYLQQSLGLREHGNFQATHHLAILFLKRAISHKSYGSALKDAEEGEAILRSQIRNRGSHDPYPYATLLTHKLRFIKAWPERFVSELTDLYELAKEAIRRHPFEQHVKEAHDDVYREYLLLATRSKRN